MAKVRAGFSGHRIEAAMLALMMCGAAGCDRGSEIPPGMLEHEVHDVLGRPSVIETNKKEMEKFFFTDEVKECLSRATKVLFYEYRLAKDVSISLDDANRVICVRRAHFVIQMNTAGAKR